jgi:hypothetical protein
MQKIKGQPIDEKKMIALKKRKQRGKIEGE